MWKEVDAQIWRVTSVNDTCTNRYNTCCPGALCGTGVPLDRAAGRSRVPRFSKESRDFNSFRNLTSSRETISSISKQILQVNFHPELLATFDRLSRTVVQQLCWITMGSKRSSRNNSLVFIMIKNLHWTTSNFSVCWKLSFGICAVKQLSKTQVVVDRGTYHWDDALSTPGAETPSPLWQPHLTHRAIG